MVLVCMGSVSVERFNLDSVDLKAVASNLRFGFLDGHLTAFSLDVPRVLRCSVLLPSA